MVGDQARVDQLHRGWTPVNGGHAAEGHEQLLQVFLLGKLHVK